MDSKLQKWLRWLDVIRGDIQELLMTQRDFHELQAMIQANAALQVPNSLYDSIARSYASHIVMGVRRQLKDDDTISLSNLFREMIESPYLVSRDYYRSLYQGSVVEIFADKDFEQFCDATADHIKVSDVCDDLTRLRGSAWLIEKYGDKVVAHRDKRGVKALPTFADLDACIHLLDELYCKYHLMFHASHYSSLLPERQYDHEAIYRVAWKPA
jgi:hypothetical protein